MDQNDFFKLCDKYAQGLVTKEEKEIVESFLKSLETRTSADHNISEGWTFVQRTEIENRIKAKLISGIKGKVSRPSSKSRSLIFSNQRVWLVAASLSLVFVVLAFIRLQSSTEISLVTVVTERAEVRDVVLPDGSIVVLNASSQLSFPTSFDGVDSREVKLVGQAFFDVRKNPDKPFIISSGKVQTTVLGTSFDVSAYPENSTVTVSVRTGKVRVTDQSNEQVLRPNEQVVYSNDQGTLVKSFIRFETLPNWQEGQLVLNGSLKEVVPQIERVYNVEIELTNDALEKCEIDAKYNNESVENVLKGLSFSLGLTYENNESKITLSGEGCN